MVELSPSPNERSGGDLILHIRGIGMLNFCLLETYLLPKTIRVRGFISFEIVSKANKNYSHEIKLFF